MTVSYTTGSIAAYAATSIETVQKAGIPALLTSKLYLNLDKLYIDHRATLADKYNNKYIPLINNQIVTVKTEYDALLKGINYAACSKKPNVAAQAKLLLDNIKPAFKPWFEIPKKSLLTYCFTLVDIFATASNTAALKECDLTDEFEGFNAASIRLKELWVVAGKDKKDRKEKSSASSLNAGIIVAIGKLARYVRGCALENDNPLWIELDKQLTSRKQEFLRRNKSKASNSTLPDATDATNATATTNQPATPDASATKPASSSEVA